MKKIYINKEIYSNLTHSLKVNFKKSFEISQPTFHNDSIRLLQDSNNFYFMQNKKHYFGIKTINPIETEKDVYISASDNQSLYLFLFLKIDKIHAAFNAKKSLNLKIGNKNVKIDFSKDLQEFTLGDISIDFSDKTMAISHYDHKTRWNFFTSFYEDELYCKITKKDKSSAGLIFLNDNVSLAKVN